MGRELCTWVLGALCLFAACLSAKGSSVEVVVLTDDNFDSLVNESAIWMVDVYAPWCTHCRQLEPIWKAFAEESGGIMVGKVDGVQQKVLLQRFGVAAYPSIFLLRDERTWHYDGVRSIAAFKEFASTGYKQAEAMAFHKSPNSIVGRAIGKIYSVPSIMRRAYLILKNKHGLSDLTIVLGALAVPVVLGAVIICCVDAAYLRKAQQLQGHEHEE